MSDSLQHHGLYSPWNSLGQNTGVGSHSLLQGIFPSQGSNPGLPHSRRILYQLSHKGSPRIVEWVVYPFSRGSSKPRNRTGSPALQVDPLPVELPGKPWRNISGKNHNLKRYMQPNVHCNCIYNSQYMDAICSSTEERIKKMRYIHTCDINQS